MGKNSFLFWGFLLCSWMRGTWSGKMCIMLCLTCHCKLRLTFLRKLRTALVFCVHLYEPLHSEASVVGYLMLKVFICHMNALYTLLHGDKSKTLISLSTLAFYYLFSVCDAAHYLWQYLSTVSITQFITTWTLNTTKIKLSLWGRPTDWMGNFPSSSVFALRFAVSTSVLGLRPDTEH